MGVPGSYNSFRFRSNRRKRSRKGRTQKKRTEVRLLQKGILARKDNKVKDRIDEVGDLLGKLTSAVRPVSLTSPSTSSGKRNREMNRTTAVF